MTDGVSRDDLKECWCCDGLHDSPGTLCPNCDDAGCNRFTDDCESEHKPAMADGGSPLATQENRCMPPIWEPYEGGYDGYFALSFNGGRQNHIVDTTTFVKAIENRDYDRVQTNLGDAETVCGRRVFGRLVPLDKDGGALQSQLCANCQRKIKAERLDDE